MPVLGLAGQPIFTVIPSKIEQDLRTAFPDLESVSVQVAFPNHIRVAVVERMPVLVWFQDGKTTWIDANGDLFHAPAMSRAWSRSLRTAPPHAQALPAEQQKSIVRPGFHRT